MGNSMGRNLKILLMAFVLLVLFVGLDSLSVYYKDIISEKNEDILGLSNDIEALQDLIDEMDMDLSFLEDTYNSLLANYNDLDEGYDDLDQTYNSLVKDYHDLEWEYANLLDSYTSLQSSYNNFDQWQDQVTYYRVYFGDMYFWQYATYSILSHWKSLYKDTSEYYKYPIEDMGVLNSFIVYDDDWSLIDQIADELWKLSADDKEYAEITLEFVHSAIFYMSDLESTGQGEYWRYPDETLFDKVGDCEDTAFLYASLLRAKGIPTVIIEYVDHLAVGVGIQGFIGTYYEYDGKRYFYAETTSNMFDEDRNRERDYKIGEIPPGLDEAYVHEAL